jgi:hypothetical protein
MENKVPAVLQPKYGNKIENSLRKSTKLKNSLRKSPQINANHNIFMNMHGKSQDQNSLT